MTQDIWEVMGLKRPDPADMVFQTVRTIGDVEILASKHLVQVKVDDEIVLVMMRAEGDLQEFVDSLQSLVVK